MTLDKITLTLDQRELDALRLLAALYLDTASKAGGRQFINALPESSGSALNDAEKLAKFVGRVGKVVPT